MNRRPVPLCKLPEAAAKGAKPEPLRVNKVEAMGTLSEAVARAQAAVLAEEGRAVQRPPPEGLKPVQSGGRQAPRLGGAAAACSARMR